MPTEFEYGRNTSFAVLLTETKFCRQNLEILPASCKREAKTALFYAAFKFYWHRVNGPKLFLKFEEVTAGTHMYEYGYGYGYESMLLTSLLM